MLANEELFTYKYKTDCDMALHIAHLKNIVFKLQSLGCQIEEKMLIMKILTTLPEKYRVYVSAWESTTREEKTIDNLTARLLMEKAKSNQSQEDVVAFKAIEKRCLKCNSSRHLANTCRIGTQEEWKKGRELICFICNKTGHLAKYCRNKRDEHRMVYPPCRLCGRRNHLKKDCFNKQQNQRGTRYVR